MTWAAAQRLQGILGWMAVGVVAGASSNKANSVLPHRMIQGSTDYGRSRLMINIPHSLFKEEGYEHRVALFGIPPYEGSIAQTVYYADSDLCDPNVDTSKGYPAREINDNGVMEPWPSPYILMVDRGNCTFVKKVRNAQRSGAAAVIIADNVCLCSDYDCMSQSGATVCETEEPIMADDGSGSDITIPSFLMFKRDADDVKRELKANRPVQIEMAWNLPNLDDRVIYDLWTTPSDLVSRDFLKGFGKIAEALGDRAYFIPNMYIYDGIKSHCRENSGESYCYGLCTNHGRYCATDPDNDLERGITGADVVVESLRRLCIWNKYGASDGIGKEWWTYVAYFYDRCLLEHFSSMGCIKQAYKVSEIDGKEIERCMEDSGGTDKDQSNSKLDSELSAQQQTGVIIIPTLFVNMAAVGGALTVKNVFTAICNGYKAGTTPAVCVECAQSWDPVACVENGGYASPDSNGSDNGGSVGVSVKFFVSFLFIFIGVLIMALGLRDYQRPKKIPDKLIREEIHEQIQAILVEAKEFEKSSV